MYFIGSVCFLLLYAFLLLCWDRCRFCRLVCSCCRLVRPCDEVLVLVFDCLSSLWFLRVWVPCSVRRSMFGITPHLCERRFLPRDQVYGMICGFESRGLFDTVCLALYLTPAQAILAHRSSLWYDLRVWVPRSIRHSMFGFTPHPCTGDSCPKIKSMVWFYSFQFR